MTFDLSEKRAPPSLGSSPTSPAPATVPLFGQLPGRNKLKGGSRLLVSPFPEIKSPRVVAGCCEACGQPPTCGQGGGNASRFPRLVHRGPRLRGQAGIGAADCPQIHSTCSAWRQAASAVAATDWPR